MTIDEVAEWLAVPRDYLRELADEGRIPHVVARGEIGFEREVVEAWVRTRRVETARSRQEK